MNLTTTIRYAFNYLVHALPAPVAPGLEAFAAEDRADLRMAPRHLALLRSVGVRDLDGFQRFLERTPALARRALDEHVLRDCASPMLQAFASDWMLQRGLRA